MKFRTHKDGSSDILYRPRVDELLEKALKSSVISISAGVGYGKTTAVSMFADKHPGHIWLRLVPSDTNPKVFWRHLIDAVSGVNAKIGDILNQSGFPDDGERFVDYTPLIKPVADGTAPYLFIIDDLSVIVGTPTENLVRKLLDYQIDNTHIIGLSSTRFGLSLHTVKGGGSVHSITDKELRFTYQEAADLFAARGVILSASGMELVMSATEGWPYALDILSRRLQNEPETDAYTIEEILPGLYDIFDQEVMSAISHPAQNQLVKLSLLEEVEPRMVEELSDKHSDELKQFFLTNSFISHKGVEHAYIFKNPFHNYLQMQQRSLSEQDRAEFLDKAGQWMVSNGRIYPAIKCFSDNKKYGKVVTLISHNYQLFEDAATGESLIRIILGFPEAFIQESPEAKYLYALCLMDRMEVSRSRTLLLELEQKESARSAEAGKQLLGEIYLGLAQLSLIDNSVSFAEYYRLARECLPDGSHYELLNRFFYREILIFCDSSNPGSLEKVRKAYLDSQQNIEYVTNGKLAGVTDLMQAELEYYTGNFNMARQYAAKALITGQEIGRSDITGLSRYYLARSALLRGELAGVLEQISAFNDDLARKASKELFIQRDCIETWVALEMGVHDKVNTWTLDYDFMNPVDRWWPAKLIQGRYYMLLRKYEELLAYLDYQQKYSEAYTLYIGDIYLNISRMVCNFELGRKDKAMDALWAAYQKAHANNITSPFVEHHKVMRRIIRYAKKDVTYDFDISWLQLIDTKSNSYAKRVANMQLQYAKEKMIPIKKTDILTEQETLIIRELAHGFSRDELADFMGVRPTTMNSYMKIIYTKLGATNVAHAVYLAYTFGILDD